LVDSRNIDTLSSELENRLDDLFGKNDIQLPNAQDKNLKQHYPLAELKNLILSIDWEITDELLDKLLQQLKDLILTYEHDKIVTTFLQILNSLGNYIKTHRGNAHPKTFKILNSVFANLDKVVLSKGMTGPAKKKILRAEMNRYKELRTQIAKSKAAAVKRRAKTVATEAHEIKDKKEDSIIRLGKSSPALDIKEKEAEPVLSLDVLSPAPGIKEKEAEPVLSLDEPSPAPGIKEKEAEPVLSLDEPSPAPDIKEKEAEPVLSLDEPAEPPAVAAKENLTVTHPQSERNLAVTTLAEAVAEIKQYIHTEIKALKEEIQSLREQK
jgi:gas vesicle protein